MNIEEMRKGASAPSQSENNPAYKFTEAGQELFGPVVKTGFNITTPYGLADLIEVDDEKQGLVTLWLSQSQLRNGLVKGRNPLERPVAEGDTVYIRFDGTKRLDDGKTLKEFSINLAAGVFVAKEF